MTRIVYLLIAVALLLLIDRYILEGLTVVVKTWFPKLIGIYKTIFWTVNITVILILIAYFIAPSLFPHRIKQFVVAAFFIILISKIVLLLFILTDDIQRLLRYSVKQISQLFSKPTASASVDNYISRSEFLATSGALIATLPVLGLGYGIISGAHDYRVRTKKLAYTNLPSSFHGLRIVQISDIHSGSFWNKKAVEGGIEKILNLKPDIILFTGDLVNNQSNEMADWISTFSKLKAPLGVFSVLGNHDYGDYHTWPDANAKRQNLQDLIDLQRQMGWDLLLDENRTITVGGEKISIVGVQNWSAKDRFPRYGDLGKALAGAQNTDFKILMSHDPSHWKAEVVSKYKEIDLMLAGHTHGMQFGIEMGGFKWSPIKYIYDEWAGLYTEGSQNLYVNRGFGYLGYPGRLGIPPEITLIELAKS